MLHSMVQEVELLCLLCPVRPEAVDLSEQVLKPCRLLSLLPAVDDSIYEGCWGLPNLEPCKQLWLFLPEHPPRLHRIIHWCACLVRDLFLPGPEALCLDPGAFLADVPQPAVDAWRRQD